MIHLAIAGYGWWGRHILARLKGNDLLTVFVVVEPVEALHDEIRNQGVDVVADLDQALVRTDIDAVILTTPHMFHEEQVAACASAGKHVFCEKPLGMNGESAARSVANCKAAKVVLGIGHERRFEPAMIRLKGMVERGALGTIMHAEAAFSHNKLVGVPDGSWRTSKQDSPGAGMTGMGIHLTDLFIWMFGNITSVQAQTRDRLLGWGTGDMVVAQLGFAAGMTASLQAILATPHFMRFHVFGSDGWVEIRNDTHPDTPGGKTHFISADSSGNQTTESLDWSDAVVANLETFARAICNDAPYPWTDHQLVHNIEVFEAIVASSDSGETVRL
ncbi:MAG: Gfo/Idh/MocA family oxidoreductase [Rhizobiaceae bacterium]